MARAVAALPVPEPIKGEQLQEGADESHDSHTPRLRVRQRHGKLFDRIGLKQPGFVDSRASRCSLLAPGQIT